MRRIDITALVPIVVFGAGSCAIAATEGPTAQTPTTGGFLLGFAIAYLTRRSQIGGWLLYYYMQLYSSLLLNTFLTLVTQSGIAQLNPNAWDSAPLYTWYVVSVGPVLLLMAIEAVIATYLLARRNKANVRRLQTVLMLLVAAAGLSLAIDLSFFSAGASTFFDVLTLVSAVVWYLYFRQSKRVRLVFIEHNWNYAAQQGAKPPLTLSERRYLRKRAAIIATVTFVASLLIMGNALGDKKPETGIFFVPLFYGAIAAALGWYLPISGKKRIALAKSPPEVN